MSRNTDFDCPNCDTITTDVPVDGEDLDLEMAECQQLACAKPLCPACPKAICDGCSLTFCSEHMTVLGGETYCPYCTKDIRDDAAEIAAEAAEAEA